MAKSNQFTEKFFTDKGFISDGKGGFSPPPSKSVIRLSGGQELLVDNEPLIVKEPIVISNYFEAKPATEWFIKNYNVPSKKNSRQNFVKNGKQISIPSKNHAEYVKMTKMQFEVFGIEFRRAVEYYKVVNPIYIQFTFVRDSHRRFDYCNAAQTIEDLIVSNKWIEDDSADHLLPVFAPYEYDKNCAGVKIKLII